MEENAALKSPIPPGKGMTTPRAINVIQIPHQNDPKTKEAIATTVRRDHGFDPNQKFAGRQP